MRITTATAVVTAEPGSTVVIGVDVVNTAPVIDGVSARVVGLDGARVTCAPEVLPLFPESEGQLMLTVEVPTTQAAGLHPLTVEVVSEVAHGAAQHLDVDLSVSAMPAVRLSCRPAVVRARRSGRFVLEVANTGNVSLDATLAGHSDDRSTTARFAPARVHVEPGTVAPVQLTVRGPRMLTGSEASRALTVDLAARRAHTIPAMEEAEDEPEITDAAKVTLQQRPTVSRGLLTALILAGIVGLWAALFLFGLLQVLGGDPLTKSPATSFFTPELATRASTTTAAAPPGATPKTGLLPPGVGGTVTGTVYAESNGLPVGRILVQAYRMGSEGRVLVGSAATFDDGSYSLAGLFPTSYWLRFSAEGHDDVWLPGRPNQDSTGVRVAAQRTSEDNDVTVVGAPARITGSVDPGDALGPVTTTVVARMLDGVGETQQVARATTDADGGYELTGLTAPGRYELRFTAEGYDVTTQVETVRGGEQRLLPAVVLEARTGSVFGTVSGLDGPLGGVTVTTTVGAEEISVDTPTVGAEGAYTLDDLPTPGTYVLTFAAPDHGTTTRAIDLEAGESEELDVVLPDGRGEVSGTLTDSDGDPIGGVSVVVGGTHSVDGEAASPSTTTLTTEPVGSFSLSGLTVPGTYTLTFTRDGYASETVPVTLDAENPSAVLSPRLEAHHGRITGRITGPAKGPVAGATVTATDGTRTWTTISSEAGNGAEVGDGGYLFADLVPGSYAVTVSMDGMVQQTALVEVGSGTTEQDLRLGTAP